MSKIVNKLRIIQKEESTLFNRVSLDPISFFDQVMQLELVLPQKCGDVLEVADSRVAADVREFHQSLHINRRLIKKQHTDRKPFTLDRAECAMMVRLVLKQERLDPLGFAASRTDAFKTVALQFGQAVVP